jgi:hypothetical protein
MHEALRSLKLSYDLEADVPYRQRFLIEEKK